MAVSYWEHGANITERFVYQMCDAFNVNRVWLETGDDPMFNAPKPSAPEYLDDA